MEGRRFAYKIVSIYLGLVFAGLVLAVYRLSGSTEMPGLGAVELFVLALPWTLLLGIEPFSRWGMVGMGAVVVAGVILNSFLLRWLSGLAQRLRRPA